MYHKKKSYSDNVFLYYEIIAVQLNTNFSDAEKPIWYFQNLFEVTCENLVTPVLLSQNMLRQF